MELSPRKFLIHSELLQNLFKIKPFFSFKIELSGRIFDDCTPIYFEENP